MKKLATVLAVVAMVLAAPGAAMASGWVVHISLEQHRIWVLYPHRGRMAVAMTTPVSYGGWIRDHHGRWHHYTTPRGVFYIYAKRGRNFRVRCHCDWNGAPMPWATFFYGGDAIHYDGLWPSHGCVHEPSMWDAYRIHNLPYGTPVVIY